MKKTSTVLAYKHCSALRFCSALHCARIVGIDRLDMTTIDFRNDPSSGKILPPVKFCTFYLLDLGIRVSRFRTVRVDIICYTIITSVMKDRFQTESKIVDFTILRS